MSRKPTRRLTAAFRKLARLSPAEAALVPVVARRLWIVRRSLRKRPFAEVLADIRRNGGRKAGNGPRRPGGIPPEQICRIVERCAQLLPGHYSCLPQALTGYLICRRRGEAVVLRIGADRREGAALEAHAWLEWEGRVILGGLPGMERFRVFSGVIEDGDRIRKQSDLTNR